MPTVTDFLQRYPQFEKLGESIIELFLSDAFAEMDKNRWGKLYERGGLALTAHLLTLNQWTAEDNGNPQRELTAESVGDLSVSYAQSSTVQSDEFYRTTAYGQEYLRLRKLVGVGFMVV
ncbi:DUF4054 domain-containing protein [Lonepinella koalarum]|uniref:Uncharacterized protein DUF4054 n=1 Tax=Lonepinella koalarum TaxID=53417 RepID=A0A4R1KU75_9PAST|nr:DUF4054 domain-containing protein [Lonepinella koalarum]MDH2927230.1 hypothetical protein [Lonepinella koalarum]TCK68100.1 uncharacterized protein DUF4054 [Lonepinella koalarum]TFJ89499.1 DUF4054 domain-containing protein [Lonepinella koalarum]TYG33465.1 DUF4054 domain-containing protein [Lonepinella koalarum]